MPQTADDISRALAYALDPVLWARDVVGWAPDPWQEKLLHSAATQLVLCCGRQVGKVPSSPSWRVTPPSLVTAL